MTMQRTVKLYRLPEVSQLNGNIWQYTGICKTTVEEVLKPFYFFHGLENL
jgi:hypothetical protein